jgi:type I restriction enzyme S subunit
MHSGGLVMKSDKYSIGELIEQVTETNSDNMFGSSDVMGMTITKEIIPTKANVNNTDLKNFLVIKPGEFIFNPRTHGKHIGFGYNNSNRSFIISWNNIGFRVKEEMRKKVLSEYLFLHFNRDEWDREACYRSWGSSTEVFTWDALCEMKLVLPPLNVQQKYVDIYKAMVANQQSYERGLEDLKLTCDAYIEDLRRKLDCKRIGFYLEESDQRNNIGLTAEAVRGLSTGKEFINTKADMNGVVLDNYKIVKPGQIAYVSDTSRRGEKISLAFNNTQEFFLVSSISTVFSTNNKNLLPEYLMLFLTRSEFDRYTRFNSWGSARETFDWDEMCNVQIPIPDIKTQKAIADIFTVYTTRKKINEQLKAQIKAICPILIRGSLANGG